MATINTADISDIVYKKLNNKASTGRNSSGVYVDINSEGKPSATYVLSTNVLTQTIPTTVPTILASTPLLGGGTREVSQTYPYIVKYTNIELDRVLTNEGYAFTKTSVTTAPTDNSQPQTYTNILSKAISPLLGSGSGYVITVQQTINGVIQTISGSNYFFDRDAGVITFYDGKRDILPTITFWRYEGTVLDSSSIASNKFKPSTVTVNDDANTENAGYLVKYKDTDNSIKYGGLVKPANDSNFYIIDNQTDSSNLSVSGYAANLIINSLKSNAIDCSIIINSEYKNEGKYIILARASGVTHRISIISDYGITLSSNGDYEIYPNVAISDDGKYFIAVSSTSQSIYIGSNYGSNIRKIQNVGNRPYSGCSINSNGAIMTVIDSDNTFSDFIYISYNYGNTWMPRAFSAKWKSISISSTGKYMTAIENYPYYSKDYGNNWNISNNIILAGWSTFSNIAMSATGKYQISTREYFPNTTNVIALSSDYGVNWSYVPETIIPYSSYNIIEYIAISGNGKYMGIIHANPSLSIKSTLYINSNYGIGAWSVKSFTNILGNNKIEGIAFSMTGKYQYITSSMPFIHSIDYGVNWAVVNTGFNISVVAGKNRISVSRGINNFSFDNTDNTDNNIVFNSPINTNDVFTNTLYSNNIITNAKSNDNIAYMLMRNANNEIVSNIYVKQNANTSNNNDVTNNTPLVISKDGSLPQIQITGGTNTNQQLQIGYDTTNDRGMIQALSQGSGSRSLNINASGGSVVIGDTADNGYTFRVNGSANAVSLNINDKLTVDSNAVTSFIPTINTIDSDTEGKYILASMTNSASNTLYLSSNYGQSFTNSGTSINNYTNIAISDSGKYQIAVSVSTQSIYVSSNYGATWTTPAPSAKPYSGCCINSNGSIMAVITTNTSDYIYISHNYGKSWTAYGLLDAWKFVAISATGQYITAVSTNKLYYSKNYGKTWTISPSSIPAGYALSNLVMSANGKYQIFNTYLVNDRSQAVTIFISNDYGISWGITFITIFDGGITNIAMSGDGKYVALVVCNIIDNSYSLSINSNYGVGSWSNITIPGFTNINSIAISATGKYWCAASADTGIAVNANFGNANTWMIAPSSANNPWNKIVICRGFTTIIENNTDNNIITNNSINATGISTDVAIANRVLAGNISLANRDIGIIDNTPLVGSQDGSTPQIRLTGVTDPAQQLLIGYDTINDRGRIQAVRQYIGYKTLTINQSGGSVVIGDTADNGYTFRVNGSASVSSLTVNNANIRLGTNAGSSNQGAAAVAIGQAAGQNNQGSRAVAIGDGAGAGVGFGTGATSQGDYSVMIGFGAGYYASAAKSMCLNATDTIITPTNSGTYINPIRNDNSSNTSIVTYNTSTKEITYLNGGTINTSAAIKSINTAGSNGWDNIQFDASPTANSAYIRSNRPALNTECGYAWGTAGSNNWINYLASGSSSLGWYNSTNGNVLSLTTGGDLTATGAISGSSVTANSIVLNNTSIKLGIGAGLPAYSNQSIAIGSNAGTNGTSGGLNTIAIGSDAGKVQAVNAIAIGIGSGGSGGGGQGHNSIAIGAYAGSTSFGSESIAIGTYAAQSSSSYAKTLTLNASGVALNPNGDSRCFIAPIRNDDASDLLLTYNTSTKEVCYKNNISSETSTRDLSVIDVNIEGKYLVGLLRGLPPQDSNRNFKLTIAKSIDFGNTWTYVSNYVWMTLLGGLIRVDGAISSNGRYGFFIGVVSALYYVCCKYDLNDNTVTEISENTITSMIDETVVFESIAVSESGRFIAILASCNDITHISINRDFANEGSRWYTSRLLETPGDATKTRNIVMSSTGQTIVALSDSTVLYSYNYGVYWSKLILPLLSYVGISGNGKCISITSTNTINGLSASYLVNFNIRRTTIGSLEKPMGTAYIIDADAPSSTVEKAGHISLSFNGKYQTTYAIFSNKSARIYTSSDYGVTWIFRKNIPSIPILSEPGLSYNMELPTRIFVSASGKYQYFSTTSQTIYKSSDYGVTWISYNPSTTSLDTGVSFNIYGISDGNCAQISAVNNTNSDNSILSTSTISSETINSIIYTGFNAISAFVSFKGSNGTVLNSFNISSVTRNLPGKYTITFSQTRLSNNYIVTASVQKVDNADDANAIVVLGAIDSFTTTSFNITTALNASNTVHDQSMVNVIVI